MKLFRMMKSARWLDPKPFPGEEFRQCAQTARKTYFVSNFGRVRANLTKIRTYNLRDGGYSTNAPEKTYDTYLKVSISRMSPQYVHRLVYAAFVGNIPDGHEINHINMLKFDNRLSNLECVTRQQNAAWTRGMLEVKWATIKYLIQHA